jgi:hypothetical protein
MEQEGNTRRKQQYVAATEAVFAHALALHMEAIGATKVQDAPPARGETDLRMLT